MPVPVGGFEKSLAEQVGERERERERERKSGKRV